MAGNPRINCALLCIHCLVTVFIAKCIPPRVDVQVAEYFLTLSQQVYRYFRATPLADRRINNHSLSSFNAPPQTLHCLVEITEGSNVHQTNHPSTPARSWTKARFTPRRVSHIDPEVVVYRQIHPSWGALTNSLVDATQRGGEKTVELIIILLIVNRMCFFFVSMPSIVQPHLSEFTPSNDLINKCHQEISQPPRFQ